MDRDSIQSISCPQNTAGQFIVIMNCLPGEWGVYLVAGAGFQEGGQTGASDIGKNITFLGWKTLYLWYARLA